MKRRALIVSAASAVCPPSGRPWVEALCAEAAAAPGRWQAAKWVLGIPGVLFAVIRANASREISLPFQFIGLATLTAGGICAALGRTDIEWHGMDDDVFLRLAVLVGGTAVLLVVVAAVRIYRAPGARYSA